MKKWDSHASEHEAFDEAHTAANDCLKEVSSRLQQCDVTAGDRSSLEDAQQQLDELAAAKESGATRVHDATTRGERLLASTSSEGCEVVRLQLRLLRETLEALNDQLVESQRRLDVTLHQLTSFEDNCDRFQTWLTETSVQLKHSATERVKLQEKKTQAQTQRAKHQDILSHQQVLESLRERFTAIATTDARAERQVRELSDMYAELCARSEELLQTFEQRADRHQRYSDRIDACARAIADLHVKLDTCTTTCDRQTLLARQQVLQRDVTPALDECERQVREAGDLCDAALQGATAASAELL